MSLDEREVRCVWPATADSREAVTVRSSSPRLTTCNGNSTSSANADAHTFCLFK